VKTCDVPITGLFLF